MLNFNQLKSEVIYSLGFFCLKAHKLDTHHRINVGDELNLIDHFLYQLIQTDFVNNTILSYGLIPCLKNFITAVKVSRL